MPNKKKEDVFRIAGRVPMTVNADLDRLASKLGMSKSAVINMAVTMGVLDLRRVVEPETLITPDIMEQFRSFFEKGKQLKLPEA